MTERSLPREILRHVLLVAGVVILAFPIYVTFVASTHELGRILRAPMPVVPGARLLANYGEALSQGAHTMGVARANVATMLRNSMIMAVGITSGKIVISLLAAFAFVYFSFPGRRLFFALVFVTLMLPVEVRIIPTYKVVSDLRMLDSYVGLILPLIVSATATFLFRQFFKSVPAEMAEAALIDGAGPMRFFWHVLVPLSRTMIAAMVVVQFIYGWNQYLWPLLITNQPRFYTLLIGINRMLAVGDQQAEWHVIMASTVLAMTPPVAIVVAMQKTFVRGMTEREK